jgi:hypothetical protein
MSNDVGRMRRFLHDNALSLALFGFFLVSIIGQAVMGWWALAEELRVHGEAAAGFLSYLATGHFLSATFENWESEFLQMSVFVLLTAILVQRGSPESRDPDKTGREEEPWPRDRSGLLRRLYSHSLSIALVTLFALSFCLHLVGSTRRSNEEALRHQQPMKTVAETLVEPEFWYESFQNWQSEFLSMGVLVVFGIFLRERGSPESKPVAAANAKTGH